MGKTAQRSNGVRAVIFDISGTVLDYGSRAPVAAFLELFARHGVTISAKEARGPMGAHKKDHIGALLTTPALAERWRAKHGSLPSEEDLTRLYAEFTPLQTEVLKQHCDIIPGALESVSELRSRGIRIANTTGYDTCMMTDLIRLAAEAGYVPDLWVCPDMVGQGRPAPWMAFHAARKLDVYPMSAFVKVGDTPSDVAEAHAAGMWAVSVTHSGNQVGLSQEEFAALPEIEQQRRVSAARASLAAAGPHYIIESVASLIPVIDDITSRLARGERP
jgi:phosphonoacetaldehyde hydrolase